VPDNIIGAFRSHGLCDLTRRDAAALLRLYRPRLHHLAWPDCYDPCHMAFTFDSMGYVLGLIEPSKISVIIGYTGSISAFLVASYALGSAVLAPGVVTVHRVLGAVALYLNIGLMFAAIYRLIWYFIPNSLTNIPSEEGWQAGSAILYFSFVTLT
jgi:hypothetical protein